MVRGTKNVPSDKEKYVCNGTPIREFPIERFNTPFWCGELMSRFSDEIEKYSGSDQTRVRRNDLPPAEKCRQKEDQYQLCRNPKNIFRRIVEKNPE